MLIHLKTPYIDRPAVLDWGRYENPEAPHVEIALILLDAQTGEPLVVATRSLSAYGIYPSFGELMLSVNGDNDGLLACLLKEGVVEPGGTLVPIGDEFFCTAALTQAAAADLRLAAMPVDGLPN